MTPPDVGQWSGQINGPARCERRGHGTEGVASMQDQRTAEIAWAANEEPS
jgi:hypothetical protein